MWFFVYIYTLEWFDFQKRAGTLKTLWRGGWLLEHEMYGGWVQICILVFRLWKTRIKDQFLCGTRIWNSVVEKDKIVLIDLPGSIFVSNIEIV